MIEQQRLLPKLTLSFQALQPCNRVISTDTPDRKYLLRQEAVDRSLYDKLGQAPRPVNTSDARCNQLPHKSKSRDATHVKQVRVKMLGQRPVKHMKSYSKRVNEDRNLSQREQNTRSNFHDPNGWNNHSLSSDSSSDDEGIGSGGSLASSPDNMVNKKETVYFNT